MNNKLKLIIIGVLFTISVISAGYFYIGMINNSKIDLPEIGSSGAKEKVTEKKDIEKDSFSAQVEIVEGKAESKDQETGDWKGLESGKGVAAGSQIRTLDGTKLVLKFEDGSEARFGQNSNFSFDVSEKGISVVLSEGDVYNKVIKNTNREYVVIADFYSIKAIGTVFEVRKNAGENTEVVVLESQVEIKNSDGSVAKEISSGRVANIVSDAIDESDLTKSRLGEEFISWNIGKDGLKIEGKDDIPESDAGELVLSAKATSKEVKFSWETDGLDPADGFKIIKSKKENPSYPGDEYKYVTEGRARSISWEIENGDTYHFRICRYEDGKCVLYSNDVVPELSRDDSSEYADKISLSVEKDGNDAKFRWKISGGDAPEGFKIVSSLEKNPKYPDDAWKYVEDSSKRSYTWNDFDEGDIYHFRICILKDGSCGTYSDDEKVQF